MNFEEFAEVECPQVFANDPVAGIGTEQIRVEPNENQTPVEPFPEWQRDLCDAHGDFNNWRGQCPVDLDQCLITKIIESGGNLDQLRGIDLGQGATTDQVIDVWLESGEPAEDLISKPAWFICLAEHLSKGESHV